MRYYYINPLKAAWMAKEFGFKFGMGSNPFINTGLGGFIALSVDSLANAGWGEPIYLHPDSIPLLQPQVGDLYLYFCPDGFAKTGFVHDIYDLNCDKGMVVNHHYHAGVIPSRIIERNGKAWFNPEVES